MLRITGHPRLLIKQQCVKIFCLIHFIHYLKGKFTEKKCCEFSSKMCTLDSNYSPWLYLSIIRYD